MTTPAPIPDGTYDAIVVDAHLPSTGVGTVLELTILDGEHKGAVVQVTSDAVDDDPVFLLGIPATIVVEHGDPEVTLEP